MFPVCVFDSVVKGWVRASFRNLLFFVFMLLIYYHLVVVGFWGGSVGFHCFFKFLLFFWIWLCRAGLGLISFVFNLFLVFWKSGRWLFMESF